MEIDLRAHGMPSPDCPSGLGGAAQQTSITDCFEQLRCSEGLL